MRTLTIILALLALLAAPCPARAQDTEPSAGTTAETAAAAPAKRTRPPATIVFESSVGDVQFPHKAHLKMRCNSCHHQIQAAALETPHDEYLQSSWVRCTTCHDGNTASGEHYRCGECHHSELENIADETLSAKVVVHQSCWKCHETSTGVGASESCVFCHVKPDHEEAAALAANQPDQAE